MTPGATQFTRTPLGPSSLASARVKPMTAALLAEYATSQDAPTCPHMLDTVTMLPLWVSLGVIVERYRPLISELSGVVNGTTKIPSTRTTLLILAAGCALTVPLLPVRSLVTASVVRRLASRKEDAP